MSDDIFESIFNNHIKEVEKYIATGGDVNAKELSGDSILHYASYISTNTINIVKLLIQNNALIDIKNRDGKTPLFYASGYGHVNAVKELVNAGADLNFLANSITDKCFKDKYKELGKTKFKIWINMENFKN